MLVSFHLKCFLQNNKNLQSLWIIINWIPTKRDKCICEHFQPQMSRRYQWGCIFTSVWFNLCVCFVCWFFCKHLTCFTEIAFSGKKKKKTWLGFESTARTRRVTDITDVHRLVSLNVLVFLLIPSVITHMLTHSPTNMFLSLTGRFVHQICQYWL